MLQTKNHANKNGLKLLKHNVVLCVRYAQPYLRSFHAGQWLSHKHTMLSSRATASF